MGEPLKPCPFCGAKPYYSEPYDRVDCTTDDCRMSAQDQMNPSQWNRRAVPEETRRLVEAVRRIADETIDHKRRWLPEYTIIEKWADKLRLALPKEGE